jgi:hypothetical protein
MGSIRTNQDQNGLATLKKWLNHIMIYKKLDNNLRSKKE